MHCNPEYSTEYEHKKALKTLVLRALVNLLNTFWCPLVLYEHQSVEPEGFEPSSEPGIAALSTCLASL